jgi:hypothetical protein
MATLAATSHDFDANPRLDPGERSCGAFVRAAAAIGKAAWPCW